MGWALKGKSGKKKVTLELGGNAGVIVHSDADMDVAADRCVVGGFSYAGQSCISVQRIYVQRGVEQKFLARLLAACKKLRVGDPFDEATDVGPMISEDAARRASSWIEEAVAGGAKVHAGGATREGAILAAYSADECSRGNEGQLPGGFRAGGDRRAVRRFCRSHSPRKRFAVRIAGGVFTRDSKLLFSAFENLEVGGVIAGDMSAFRIDHMPYGGVKDSGIGREGLRYAIEEMTEPRILRLESGDSAR